MANFLSTSNANSGIAQPRWLYITALLIALAVTVGLVTLRSWRAATENPADVVKSN
ncbi:MAG: hypothetical protein IJ979_06115 [Tidjanibacter sp.]|nr:hypothetical protein [Tidjanibacter sp.]MBR6812948.1 hypothetical protein [Tidjanibacter sp.]